ncbi:hypothetical protein B0H10DRAFT_2233229 [Mycena sp. CBHHK59/15]|nr:hypothetical protein B0H10DRAFT_2233229 [Mycena sp. CBHHK59/15]
MADVLEICDSDDEFPDGIALPPAKATKSMPRKKVVEFTPPLATRSASKKLLFTPTTPDSSRAKRGKVSKTQLEAANRPGTPSGNGTLWENEHAESPPWSSSPSKSTRKRQVRRGSDAEPPTTPKHPTAEHAPAMNTSPSKRKQDNIDNGDSLKLTTLKRSPVKKAKPILDDGSDDADNVIISMPVTKSKMKATMPNTKKIGTAKTKASDGIEEPTLSSSANGKGKESSLSSRKAKTKMDVDGEDHAGDVGGKLEAAAQINSRKPKAKPSGGDDKKVSGSDVIDTLTFAQHLQMKPLPKVTKVPLKQSSIYTEPEHCEVSVPCIQDPMLKKDYLGGHLPKLRARILSGWSTSTNSRQHSDPGFWFSNWGIVSPHMLINLALAPIRFSSHGKFINLSRVHPSYLSSRSTGSNSTALFTPDGLAICMTTGCAKASSLLTPGANNRKHLDILLYTQELERLQVETSATSSPKKKVMPGFTKPVLDATDTIPIYDGRAVPYTPAEISHLHEVLPPWEKEIPMDSCVVVGHTVGGYYDGASDARVNFNILMVILISMPVRYDDEAD